MASTPAYAEPVALQSTTSSRRVTTTALLLAGACVLGLVEAALPGVPLMPWLRFGLANIAVVVALAAFGVRVATVVSVGRVLIVSLATGTLATPAFSMALAGALLSLLVMALLSSRSSGLSAIGWSAVGSAAHVLAQIVVAGALLGTGSLMLLAPPSVLAALVFGALTGSLARLLVSRLPL